MNTLINKSAVKALALETSKQKRNGKFTRVSQSFLDDINLAVRLTVESRVMRHPGLGVTLKG